MSGDQWRHTPWQVGESMLGGPCVTAGPNTACTVADLIPSQDIAEHITSLHNAQLNEPQSVRVVVVVDWRRQRVHGLTGSNEQARQWCRELVARYDGDPLAATMSVGLVDHPPQP